MAVFNHLRKEIDAKIVYYGPGISGKTTNLQFIHEHLKPDQRGRMVSLATNEERTLFFDFLPIELESVRGFKTRFHLYTVPGQVYYGATRRAVLLGADGLIFVADSQAERMEDNLFSLQDLAENLRYYGKNIETTPLIIQYNKRDLSNILPLEELNQKINYLNVPYFESVAVQGKGVFETLTMACRLVLKTIEEGVEARRGQGKLEVVPERPPIVSQPMEKSISSPELPRESVEAAQAKAFQPGKSVLPPGVPTRASSRRAGSDKIEEEKKKGSDRSFFSRFFAKKVPEQIHKTEEEPRKTTAVVPGKMRIISCGQPRISSPSSLKIPLTIEIDGIGKSFSMKLEINLEQIDPNTE